MEGQRQKKAIDMRLCGIYRDVTSGGGTAKTLCDLRSIYIIIGTGTVITVLMVLLFMDLRLTRNAPAIAEKIMMGIDLASIRPQELFPMLIQTFLRCLTGTQ